MNRLHITALCALASGVMLLGGCQKTDSADIPSAAEESLSTSETEDTSNASVPASVEPLVKLDQTYWSGSNIRVRMLFDPEGNCKYGYIGKYDLQTTADGTPVITFIYFADEGKDQMASSTFALRENGDGTYSKTLWLEDEEPDFDDASVTTDLSLTEGTDGLMSGALFEGVYLSTDGQYYTFHEDGTFAMETWMKYAADDQYMEIIGSDSSTVYTYDAGEDYSTLTLYKEGQKVMDLATEEAIEQAGDEAASETELPSLDL